MQLFKKTRKTTVVSAASVPWETLGQAAKQPQDPTGEHVEEQAATLTSHGQTQSDFLL